MISDVSIDRSAAIGLPCIMNSPRPVRTTGGCHNQTNSLVITMTQKSDNSTKENNLLDGNNSSFAKQTLNIDNQKSIVSITNSMHTDLSNKRKATVKKSDSTQTSQTHEQSNVHSISKQYRTEKTDQKVLCVPHVNKSNLKLNISKHTTGTQTDISVQTHSLDRNHNKSPTPITKQHIKSIIPSKTGSSTNQVQEVTTASNTSSKSDEVNLAAALESKLSLNYNEYMKFGLNSEQKQYLQKRDSIINNDSVSKKKKASHQEYNDFISDNNDLSQQVAKTLVNSRSSSVSKNFMSRLNQFSQPLTRKLKFWNKKSFQVNDSDPSFKVIYLGNLGIQFWSKDEQCLEKPIASLWNNYVVNMKTEIMMRLTICNSGLKAVTRQHGLTQYWSNRLGFCGSHKNHPRVFAWIYRHEGKKMRQELRCHAVLCPSIERVNKMVAMLNTRLSCALQEFRREKKMSNHVRLDTSNVGKPNFRTSVPQAAPLRRQILAKGSANFRPPLDRSKSAPKLSSIVEESDFDEDDYTSHDEFEYQESFEDRNDSCSDEENCSYTVEEANTDPCADNNSHSIEVNSLTTITNEETSITSAGQDANEQSFIDDSKNNSISSSESSSQQKLLRSVTTITDCPLKSSNCNTKTLIDINVGCLNKKPTSLVDDTQTIEFNDNNNSSNYNDVKLSSKKSNEIDGQNTVLSWLDIVSES